MDTVIRTCVQKYSKKRKQNYLSVKMDGIGYATCWEEPIFQDVQEACDSGEMVEVEVTQSDEATDRNGDPFNYLNDISRSGAGEKKMNEPDTEPSFT
jgi:hypothetical protein